MRYSTDLRDRALAHVMRGGNKAETARIFGISRQILYYWISNEGNAMSRKSERRGKIDKAALAAHVRDYPDALLRERAAHFGVTHQSLWMMLKKLKITKKNDTVSGSEVQSKDDISAEVARVDT